LDGTSDGAGRKVLRNRGGIVTGTLYKEWGGVRSIEGGWALSRAYTGAKPGLGQKSRFVTVTA